MKITAIYALCLAILSSGSALWSEPLPGDIFREYTWSPDGSGGGWQRVTDPKSNHAAPNIGGFIQIDDLEHAIRAEVYLELWGATPAPATSGCA